MPATENAVKVILTLEFICLNLFCSRWNSRIFKWVII